MSKVFLACLLLVVLTGCTAQFWRDYERNRAAWNGYVNSPAYHQTVTTSTIQTPYGTTQCTMTSDDRTGDSSTQCH